MSSHRNPKLSKIFGANLRRLRLAKGYTTRDLADHAEIALSQIWVLEKGRGNPSLSTLIALATALEVPITELITKDLFI